MTNEDLSSEHDRLWAQLERLWDEFYGERERRRREREEADRQQAGRAPRRRRTAGHP